MPNLNSAELAESDDGLRRARVGELAGADHLGVTLYELAPGDSMHYHYHLQREELLVVLEGTVAVRTPEGWRDAPAGEVLAFACGARGAHGYENRTDSAVRLLMISEQNAPNVSVYPDTNEVGIFDAAHPKDRQFGALFNLADAISAYGGGGAKPEA